MSALTATRGLTMVDEQRYPPVGFTMQRPYPEAEYYEIEQFFRNWSNE